MRARSVLCICSVFPPVAAAGTHRIRAVVRHLPSFGWQPVVVTAEAEPDMREDPSLLEGCPANLTVYRTRTLSLLGWLTGVRSWVRKLLGGRRAGAARPAGVAPPRPAEPKRGWADWLSWWATTPDQLIGWLPGGVAAALGAVRRRGCGAIYSSAPRWTGHLIALLAKRLTGRRWVADFRDPWRGNPFQHIPYKAVDGFDRWLEGRVVRGADWVVCNTEPVRRDFVARFPDLADKFVVIPNGFEPEEYAHLTPCRPVGEGTLLLTHAGAFYGPRRPQPLLQALRLLRDDNEPAPPVCLQLVGRPTYDGRPLQNLAAEHGVADSVLVPGEVSHRRSLELMRGSDVQILVGFGGPGAELQVPGKLFEYLGVARPILALAPRDSAIAHVLAASGVRAEVCDPDSPEQIARAIRRIAADRAARGGGSPAPSGESLLQFTRREQVRRIAELLEAGPRARPDPAPLAG